MRTSEIVDAVARALRSEGVDPVYPRRLSALDGREGVVVRTLAPRVAAEYIDGTCDRVQPLQVISKRRKAADAMRDVEDAEDSLFGSSLAVGGVEVTLTRPSDLAQELELNESGWFAWETTVDASYRD